MVETMLLVAFYSDNVGWPILDADAPPTLR